jgi:hypothetical protein
MDLSAISESLQRGLGEIPRIAIVLALIAGPTAAFIGYQLLRVTQRMQSSQVGAPPLWVCHDCRSVNELRISHCYRCGAERDAAGELELIVDQPASRPSTFEAPAGSPFAATGANAEQRGRGPGTAVMADRPSAGEAVAVGPGPMVETETEAGATIVADAVPAAEASLESGA